MIGPDGVRDKLCGLLETEMPRKIPLVREAWNLDAVALPDVEQFISGDAPEELIKETCVIVVNPRLLRGRRTGDFSDEGEPEYHNRYSCRVYVWAKGPDWDRAMAARDHLTFVARTSLLQYPTLTIEGGDTGFRVEEDTYTEDFGVPVRTQAGSRVFAAAIMSVDITVEEFVDVGSTKPALGSAETVAATTYAVGPLVPFHGEE